MGEPSTEILVRAIPSPASGPGSTLRELFAEAERGHEIFTRQTQSRRPTVQVNYQPDSVMSWINQFDQRFNNVEVLGGRIMCGCDDDTYGAATKPIVNSSWARAETGHPSNNISAASQMTATTPERAMHVAKVIEVRQENFQSFALADSKMKEDEAMNASKKRVPQEPRYPLGTLIARETATSWVSRHEENGCLAFSARNRGTETELAVSAQPVQVHSVVATVSSVQRDPSSPLDWRNVATRSGQVSERIKQFETVATGRVLQERPQQLGALLAKERAMCFLKEDRRVVPITAPIKAPNSVQQAPVMQVKVLNGAANPQCQEPGIQLGVLLAEEIASSRAGTPGLPTADAGAGHENHVTSSSSQERGSSDARGSEIQDESVNESTSLVHSQLHPRAVVARDLATSTSQETNQDVFPETMGGVSEWVQRETKYQLGELLAAEVESSCAQNSGVPTEGEEGRATFWSVESTVGESDSIMQVEPASATTSSVIPKPQSSLGELIAMDAITCANQQNKRGRHNIVFTTAANSIRQLKALTAQEVATSCVRGSGVPTASRTGDDGVSPASTFKEQDGCTQRGSMRDTTSPVVQQPTIQLRALIAEELATSTGNNNDEIMHVEAGSQTPGPRFQEPETRVGELFAQEVARSCAGDSAGTGTGGEGFSFPAAHPDRVVEGESSTEIQQEPRLQLGALLKKTRGEHGWLPLGRSPIGSPLLFRNQSPSVGNSRFETRGILSQGSPLLSTMNPPSISNSRSETGGVSLGCSFLSRNRSWVVGTSRYEAAEPSLNLETLCSNVPQVPGDLPIQPQLIHSTESEVISIPSPAASTPMTERPPNRVSLMSLLNQDIDLDESELITSGVNPLGNQCDMEEVDEGQATEELDPMCCVCMVGHKGAAFIPCGHTFCRKCCREVRRSLGTCPLCNRDILDILDIY